MIPKVIHYCWFGGAPLPELAEKCIESWKKYCPDYEIKRWDESNFDVNENKYCREAYEAKKWAFVSDYARFKILYDEGGVYFDTDVELLKPIDDILQNGSFMCIEKENNINWINPGLGMAAAPGLDIYKEIIDDYNNSEFIKSNGTQDITTVVKRVTNIFKRHGFKSINKIQNIKDIKIYPTEFFCPKNYDTGITHITENTYSIHHYEASWVSEREKWRQEFVYKYYKCFGRFVAKKLSLIAYYMKDGDIKGLVDFIVNKIKG